MSYYSDNDCNTICDITGFQVKLSETMKMWNGRRVIPAAFSERHPQDYAPSIIKTVVHKESRPEQYYSTQTAASFNPI